MSCFRRLNQPIKGYFYMEIIKVTTWRIVVLILFWNPTWTKILDIVLFLHTIIWLNFFLGSTSIRSYSGSHFPSFRLNTEKFSVSRHIQSKWGKMRARMNNTEYGHFLRSVSNIYNGTFYENIYRLFLPIISIPNVPSNMLARVVIPLWILLLF